MLLSTGALAQSADGVSAEVPSEELMQPTEEEIIVSAMEIYSWFTISPLDVDYELAGDDGSVYRVADEVLCREDALMGMVALTFAPVVIEDMLSYQVYTVIDGMLYTVPGGRGMDENIEWVEYQESYADEQKIIYTVTVHYFGEKDWDIGPDVFEFVREYQDGLWLFTEFPFFW